LLKAPWLVASPLVAQLVLLLALAQPLKVSVALVLVQAL
jgi:hypothetical protein